MTGRPWKTSPRVDGLAELVPKLGVERDLGSQVLLEVDALRVIDVLSLRDSTRDRQTRESARTECEELSGRGPLERGSR